MANGETGQKEHRSAFEQALKYVKMKERQWYRSCRCNFAMEEMFVELRQQYSCIYEED